MKSSWSEPRVLETLYSNWESYPASAGVYLISRDRPIQRIGRVDKMSIIYIGKTKNIRERLWAFWKGDHSASGLLWTHISMAQIVLDESIRSVSDVEKYLGTLTAMYSAPIDKLMLDDAERTLLFAYIQCYGEAPPLNSSLPRRWEKYPSSYELRWAENGILR